MPATKRVIAAIVALAALMAGCSPAAEEAASTTTTLAASTTTTATTTTSPTTTTEPPLSPVSVDGEVDAGLLDSVEAALSAINDPRIAAGLDEQFAAALSGATGALEPSYEVVATTATLASEEQVAVVTLDNEDVLLAATSDGEWRVVGASLASVGADPWFGAEPRRVLVLGSDARPGQSAPVHRMDSIHILTAAPADSTGAILGFPRDSWIDSPYGSMRINALTSSGRGPDAIFEHFTETWEIPLDGYILTGFAGFEDIVAATLGRIELVIPIPIPEQQEFPGFRSGEQTLPPDRVLDFSRTRKKIPGGDFTRSFHQGIVMLAALTMVQRGTVDTIPELLAQLSKYVDTNLSAEDMIQLGVAAMSMDIGTITNEVLPGSLGRAGGGASVVFLDDGYESIVDDVIDDGIRNDSNG